MEKRNLSRKTFLKGSGAALATLGLTSCAARTSGSANKEELADTSDAPKEEAPPDPSGPDAGAGHGGVSGPSAGGYPV